VAVLFFPIVLLYQGWSFHVFHGRVAPPPAAGEADGAGPVTTAGGDSPAAAPG